MLKVKPLEKVLEEHPEFKAQWNSNPNGGMKNPRFGSVDHVVVCREDETPIFDQYSITEQPGAVIVPWDDYAGMIRVGLITQERFIPGKIYIQAPMGFARANETELKASYRELLEETGLSADELVVLGRINPDTAFFRTDFPILGARFDKLEEIANPGGDGFIEKITKVSPYRFSDIRKLQEKGSLECGITSAALFLFGMYKPEFYKT